MNKMHTKCFTLLPNLLSHAFCTNISYCYIITERYLQLVFTAGISVMSVSLSYSYDS